MNNNSLYEMLDNGGVRIALIGVLSILALFLLAQTISIATHIGRSGTPATDVITVQGQGQATLAPDVAHISFTVQNTAKTVSDAQSQTTEQTNAALAFVEEQNVDERDIKTLSYSINPEYSYPNPCPMGSLCPAYSTPKITGYQVSQTIQITVRDLTAVGEMLSGLGKLGVQNVSGPAFALDDSTAGYNAARADAIMKAKRQAKLLAKQLDVDLGDIVNFSESSGGYAYPMYDYRMGGEMAMTKEVAPNVPAGENMYNATVSITYEIR